MTRLGGGLGVVAWAALTVWWASGGDLAGQSVEGVVLSSFTGEPVQSVTIRLVDEEGVVVASSLGDAEGEFRIRPRSQGAYFLHGEALGYFSMVEGPLKLVPEGAVHVEVVLRPSPLPVESLSVTVEGRNPALEPTGFCDRLSSG